MTTGLPAIPEFDLAKPWKIVTHHNPDTDAWVCLWLMDRFVIPTLTDSPETVTEIRFVRAGERLPAEEEDGYNVVYMDTGLSAFDQHALDKHQRTSSAQMLAEHYGLDEYPGLRFLIDLTVRTDNVEITSLTPDSFHFSFKGLPRIYFGLPEEKKWGKAWDYVSTTLDMHYDLEKAIAQSPERLAEVGRHYTTQNGFAVSVLRNDPNPRQCAFDHGADVVIWSQPKRNGVAYGIQVNLDRQLDLAPVLVALRKAEAAKRGVELTDEELNDSRPVEKVGAWFLHGSRKFVACGTRSFKFASPQEASQQKLGAVRDIVLAVLSKTEIAGTLTPPEKLPKPPEYRKP